MIDSHCHLDDERLAADLPAVLARARAAGVSAFVLAGVDPAGWQAQDALARREPDMAVAYGVHPRILPGLTDAEADAMVELLAATLDGGSLLPPVGLGEVGLDGLGQELRACMDRQERVMRAQLALARAHDLPLVLHVLRAHGRALEILKSDGVPRAGGVLHCYSGPADLVGDFVALGLHVSFAGPVSYENARKVHEAARVVPADRLLVETDAPDLTPEPERPGRNEPAFLPHVVAALARVRGEDVETVASTTARNARRLFNLDKHLETRP
jgi:TatD DNase family protein